MTLDRLRWLLLPVAAVSLLVILFKGGTAGRWSLFAGCALIWYGLSRRKTFSLDRDRFRGGRLGSALDYWKKRSSAANL